VQSPLDIILTVLTAAGGAGVIILGLGAWLGKVWADRIAQRQKFDSDIDLDLRARRISVYKELWEGTAILPKWPRASDVTYEQLLKFSTSLRDWYFHAGGMYLSRKTHDEAYTPLQNTLTDVLHSKPVGLISEQDYDRVREKCSALRTALATDIESRRESPV
jgi:hypothetical protein